MNNNIEERLYKCFEKVFDKQNGTVYLTIKDVCR